jgi:hypothetical protein
MESKQLMPRIRKDLTDKETAPSISVEDFLNAVAHEYSSRSNSSTL